MWSVIDCGQGARPRPSLEAPSFTAPIPPRNSPIVQSMENALRRKELQAREDWTVPFRHLSRGLFSIPGLFRRSGRFPGTGHGSRRASGLARGSSGARGLLDYSTEGYPARIRAPHARCASGYALPGAGQGTMRASLRPLSASHCPVVTSAAGPCAPGFPVERRLAVRRRREVTRPLGERVEVR
jgi:hypothetical protein